MTVATPAPRIVEHAKLTRRSLQLDLFRGFAAIFMIVNHAGYQLLGAWAVGDGWPTWFVFVGSAAPALFFLATGVGSGLGSGRGEPFASAARKVVLLLLADALLNWSTGTLLGLDFFGFAAVATAALFWIRRRHRPMLAASFVLVLVLLARFGLAPLIHGHVEDNTLVAFITGNASVHHVSYPLGPWLAFPLTGFLLGRRWRLAPSAPERWIVASTGGLTAVLAALLAARGATVFRWGSVSIAYFLAAVGIVAAAWLCAGLLAGAASASARRLSLRGPASLLIVPLHYGLLGLLEALSPPPWHPLAWAPVTVGLVVIVFVSSSMLVTHASRLEVPGAFVQLAVAAAAVAVGLLAWANLTPLPRLEACSAGQVVIALLLLWSSNRKVAHQRPASGTAAGASS